MLSSERFRVLTSDAKPSGLDILTGSDPPLCRRRCHARSVPDAAHSMAGPARRAVPGAPGRSSCAGRRAGPIGTRRAPGRSARAPGPILWPSMRPRTCMADADRLRALGCPTARSAGADPTPQSGRSTARSALQVLGQISGRPRRYARGSPGQFAPEGALRPRAWREAETAPGVQRSGPSSIATPMVSSRRPEAAAI